MLKVEYLGNRELLKLKNTAFLASSTISSETKLRCYDWATEMPCCRCHQKLAMPLLLKSRRQYACAGGLQPSLLP